MRYTVLALTAATVLSVAACASSGTPAPAASRSSSSSPTGSRSSVAPTPPTADGKDRVDGRIASVSGNAIQVNQKNGTGTVDVSASTRIAEITPAQLTDMTPGSCITARSPHDGPPGAATRTVMIATSANGSCSAPQNARAGVAWGTVASVNGNTLVVNVNQNGNASQTNVAVDSSTTYVKRTTAAASVIAQGMCLAARGTKNGSGVLQATNVTVAPANNGTCPAVRR